MLVVIAVGLYWRRWYSGLLLAMALGFFADVLSGSLLGTHALVSLVIFVVAWLSSRQLNLRSPLALSIFAAIASLFDVFATLALTGFFVSVSLSVGALWADGWIHAAVNAIFAVPVAALVAAVISRVDGRDRESAGSIAGEGRGADLIGDPPSDPRLVPSADPDVRYRIRGLAILLILFFGNTAISIVSTPNRRGRRPYAIDRCATRFEPRRSRPLVVTSWIGRVAFSPRRSRRFVLGLYRTT